MIQMDDAGSGSLVGGTCIGAMRVETGEYAYDFIPVQFYREGPFQSKKYLKKTSSIGLRLLRRLQYGPEEGLSICQGYMFDALCKKLAEKKIPFTADRIGEPLQSRIEETFQHYALSLGVPPHYVRYTRYPMHFHRILRWVYADYEKRVPLCKTGWKSFRKFGCLTINRQKDTLYQSNYTCLRCGLPIFKGSRVLRITYTTNCPNILYLHERC